MKTGYNNYKKRIVRKNNPLFYEVKPVFYVVRKQN